MLGSDPSSDRIALGVLTTNKTVWLSVWSGSAWGSTTTATTGAQTKDSPVVAVAFESLTGRALAVYGEGKNVRYRLWTSVSQRLDGRDHWVCPGQQHRHADAWTGIPTPTRSC